MPTVHHLRAADYRVMPWKNGKGTTTELAVGQARGGGAPGGGFAWRLSLAEVPESGPFSDFAGYDRTILMVEGEGMTLDFGGHGEAVVARRFEPVGFSGDWGTDCRLHGGPLRDLNLMVARDLMSAEVEILRLGGTAPERNATRAATHDVLLCHLLDGSADVAVNGGPPVELKDQETLLVENDHPSDRAPRDLAFGAAHAVLFLACLRWRPRGTG